MNFILKEMTHLRYFIPLATEGNKRNIQSCFYVGTYNKYNCPRRHHELLLNFSDKYKFKIKPIQELKKTPGLCFFIEGAGLEDLSLPEAEQTRISLTYGADYRHRYDNYIELVDFCIFPSRFFIKEGLDNHWFKKFNKPKTLAIGSTKYDIELNKRTIYNKYKLQEKDKHCLIVLPKSRYFNEINFNLIIKFLRTLNYKIITKNRGKEPYRFKDGDINIVDEDWYPHPTMELIKVSDLVINFDSTTIEECVALQTKVINFNLKKNHEFPTALTWLYNENFCANIKSNNYSIESLTAEYEKISRTATDLFFNKFSQTSVGENNCCEKVLDLFL